MKTSQAAVLTRRRTALAERIYDYIELTKPRIAALVLLTVAVGGIAAGHGMTDPSAILHAVIGTALVAAASSALNQYAERESDALMRRTANRPLPAGRLLPADALWLGAAGSAAGVFYLLLTNGILTALLALATLIAYVWVYTPLKRCTSLNTIVGAVAGASGPVIGWAAVRGSVNLEALVLFTIVFLWQFPHFLAIAWLYRDDYARAGQRMLPTSELGRRTIGIAVVSYTLVLVPISLLPAVLGMAGDAYFWGALVLGMHFLGCGTFFAQQQTTQRARFLLWSSLVYLPAVFALLLLDLTRYQA